MNIQTVMMVFLLLVFVLAVFSAQKLRKQIRCRYTSRSKQTYEKFIKSNSQIVVFEGKKYYIVPSCVTHHWFTKGMSQLFPTFMPEISFTWENQYPVDPNTGKPVIISPENANIMRQEVAMSNYAGSQERAINGSKGKGGLMDKLMPIMTIVAVLGVVYLVYTNMQSAKNDKVTQQAIIDIYNTFNTMGQPVIPSK